MIFKDTIYTLCEHKTYVITKIYELELDLFIMRNIALF